MKQYIFYMKTKNHKNKPAFKWTDIDSIKVNIWGVQKTIKAVIEAAKRRYPDSEIVLVRVA